jgi:hypothetical protein
VTGAVVKGTTMIGVVTDTIVTGEVMTRYFSDWRSRKLNIFFKSIHFPAHFVGP